VLIPALAVVPTRDPAEGLIPALAAVPTRDPAEGLIPALAAVLTRDPAEGRIPAPAAVPTQGLVEVLTVDQEALVLVVQAAVTLIRGTALLPTVVDIFRRYPTTPTRLRYRGS
jgi:hypothetical protein